MSKLIRKVSVFREGVWPNGNIRTRYRLRQHYLVNGFSDSDGRSRSNDFLLFYSLEKVRAVFRGRWDIDEMIIEGVSVNEAVRARRDVAQHILLGQQIVLRRFSDFVSNCLVELDALSPLLSDDACGLNGNPDALMLFERVEGF